MPPKKENPRYVRGRYTEGSKESVDKYVASHYDQVLVRMPKGQLAKLREFAKKHNISVNGMYNTALKRYINKIDKEACANIFGDEEIE